MRLSITVPNPAHAQFISRESTDPREETRALSATRARQLIGLPDSESVVDYRDRAILKTFWRRAEATPRPVKQANNRYAVVAALGLTVQSAGGRERALFGPEAK